MRSYVADHRDQQDAAPVMVDCTGEAIYPGEHYYITEDDKVLSESSFRELRRYMEQGRESDEHGEKGLPRYAGRA